MTKLETVTVPTDLGEWLQARGIGDSLTYFSTIDALYHHWEGVIGEPTGSFITDDQQELIEVILGTRGYEIEEPPKYYVLDKYGVAILKKNAMSAGGGVGKSSGVNIYAALHRQDEAKYQLTEKEIKDRSEEHTSELQSRFDLVCRLLLEKKKIKKTLTPVRKAMNNK